MQLVWSINKKISDLINQHYHIHDFMSFLWLQNSHLPLHFGDRKRFLIVEKTLILKLSFTLLIQMELMCQFLTFFFSQDPQVDCYQTSRVKTELHLSRENLVGLAILLGCDYIPKVDKTQLKEVTSE